MAETVVGRSSRGDQPGAANRAFKAIGRALNPYLMPLVASGVVPVWGVVHHRGRSSGRQYRTPVAVLATPEHFLIPLPFGRRTDWCRNLLADGGGAVRWKGAEYQVDRLAVIDTSAALPALGRILRVLVPAFGIKQFLYARRTRSSPAARE